MKSLDSVFDLNWSARTVIEASAGTGKTYTIVGLYVRLLVEKELSPDQILVMTFTNKATAELRGRILQRLRECVNLLEGVIEAGNDSFLNEFIAEVEETDRIKVIDHLRDAIQNFDDSRVFTIHGFCQRILSEEPLIAGTPMEMEIVQTDDLLLEAAEDYWRNVMHTHSNTDAGRYYIQKLLSIGSTPEELIGRNGLGNLFRQHGAIIEGRVMNNPIDYLDSLISLRRKLADEWSENREEILEIFGKCDVSRFQQHLEGRLKKLTDFLTDTTYSKDAPGSLQYFTSDYLYDENKLKKNDAIPTEKHRFFELCNEYYNLVAGVDHVTTTIKRTAYDEISALREERSKKSGAMTFDDLILTLNSALKDEVRGPALANKLREAYPFALVDEFQDTDAIQYSILDSIYPKNGNNSSFLMIGDPKQAIYGFRGADVYTYLKAKVEGDPQRYSLNHNFRSSKHLIEAVNAIYGPNEHHAFLEEEIPFFDSLSGNLAISEDYSTESKSPLSFTIHPDLFTSKGKAKEFAFNQTVRQIADLLENETSKIKDSRTNSFRPVKAGDVAILVNTNREAVDLKSRLKSAGIGSVTYSNKKVFETLEAKRIELLMDAVLNPQKSVSINNALISGLFGIDSDKIYELINDDVKRQSVIDELLNASEIWIQSGFHSMLRRILNKQGRIDRLVELQNSERILTNINQLAEICSGIEQEENLDPAALHTRFKKEISQSDKNDELTLLLESDRNLVKISTIHGCKGLEFPIVFCPVLWESKKPDHRTKEYPYHTEDGDHIINIDSGDTPERATAQNGHIIESIAEDVRKAYVALTRAKYECRIIWATHNESHTSGLGAALFGNSLFRENLDKKMKEGNKFTQQAMIDILEGLERDHPNCIHLVETENSTPQTHKIEIKGEEFFDFNTKMYSGRKELYVKNRIESFSSLSGHKSEAGEPDYDQITEWYVGARDRSEITDQNRTIFSFPKGAMPGTVIHKLFEHPDFSFDEFPTIPLNQIIKDVLDDFGISDEWTDALSKMMSNVVHADYQGLQLNEVSLDDQLREMEFHFPVKGLSAELLIELIRGTKSKQIFEHSDQFLNGFIDLIVRQNGKFYILDYKSNHLGDTAEDYSLENMKSEIEAAGYDLQYHIYTLALKKFLSRKIKDFNYERNFGGVMYLFVRGMQQGSSNGIWFDKPSSAVMENLENRLSR